MTEETARRVANVLMGAAAVGVAYYVARTPALRRLAWRVALTAMTSRVPAWFARELQDAWAEAGPRRI